MWARSRTIYFLVISFCLVTGCSSSRSQAVEAIEPPVTQATEPVLSKPSSTPLATATQPRPIPSPTAQATQVLEKPDLRYLDHVLRGALEDFDGLYSIFVVDLKEGGELDINGDLAIAGMSLVKIPILVETYRVLDNPPNVEQTKLISETMGILSGNATANWLLEGISGRQDAFAGADTLTNSMKALGLFNTFIAVPYDQDPVPGRLPTYLTPANQRTDQTTFPDPYRQTTIGDLGRLLTLIYACAENGTGRLIEQFSSQISAEECQEMLGVMQRLKLDAFIESGVPEGMPVAHKHGWIDDTHGDAGIIFSPAGDYVLAVALFAPEWLEWETAAPLIAEVSRLTYVHFNDPQAYQGLVLPEKEDNEAVDATPTPDLPHAFVDNTSGIGLTVRASPGGDEIAIVPDGTILALLEEPSVASGGYDWFHVLLPDGQSGWAAGEFFTRWEDE